MPRVTTGAVVIGIGNPFRNDDGIGPAVAAQVEEQRLPGVRVVISDGEPAGLLEAWSGADLAVLALPDEEEVTDEEEQPADDEAKH